MEIRKVLALRGPNIWARFPVLEAWVDLKELKDSPSNQLPGFNERLMAWLPGMIEHRCSLGRPGGFFERLREGTYQGHILEHVTLELQCLAGTPVGFGKARETAEAGVYKVVIEYEDEAVGRACLETAHRLLQAAVLDLPFVVEAEVARLRDVACQSCLQPGARAIVEAALKAGVPCRRLDAEHRVVLGQGHRQRRLLTTEADPGGESSLASLFPEGEDGRIPVVGVTGVNGKTTVTRLIARILREAGRTVGMTCTDGIFVNESRLEIGDCSGPQSARIVLQDPRVEAAVLETARGGILREGLGYDRTNVSVVTNIGEGDHLGLSDIMTPEQLADVKSTLVDVVPPDGTAVLNAADPLVARMGQACRGSLFYFALDGTNPIVVEHRAQGGRAVFCRDNAVVLAEGSHEEVLCPLSCVPLTRGGRIGFQVENVLAAVAAAQALGVPHDTTRAALEAFESNMELTPGRFNVVEVNGATAIFDYGHNPSALVALVEAIESFPSLTRSAVFTVAGDRPDESILKQAALLGDAFDHVLIYESPDCRRGRAEGETFTLLRLGLARGGRVKQVTELDGEFAAIEAALLALRPGDLTLIQVDSVEAALEHSRAFIAALATPTPPRSERDIEPSLMGGPRRHGEEVVPATATLADLSDG
ncbi:cyanophycin synthetase family protein [Singulisphaera acidiphila]|uniref:UDP-N-acetylmuramyl tripeptide synthase n=1 Tax=Singulisphaera acidiphila (strain ATCC BAA-1392 / DSM 18658 / VKM B-2454 / MOB10) TaxID=886293 RepID=L0D837_SINAD|nr:Mur ligase family protein [Singulisphaera acidiphila]AGA24988.1 UDP-N-acetylmuramyl tripeptide synthase [Singulisphaera acidiphila DSM 18658]